MLLFDKNNLLIELFAERNQIIICLLPLPQLSALPSPN